MTRARFIGGPYHNKIREVYDRRVDVQKPVGVRDNRAAWNDPYGMYPGNTLSFTVKRGTYWYTPEIDKQGNPIFAWTGWK